MFDSFGNCCREFKISVGYIMYVSLSKPLYSEDFVLAFFFFFFWWPQQRNKKLIHCLFLEKRSTDIRDIFLRGKP